MNRLTAYTNEISKLCETHKVKSLYAFGSVLSDKFGKDSDIDLLVEFADIDVDEYADNYFDFKFSLQKILKRPIDLLESKALRNPYFKQAVHAQRQLIYGASN
ncbi:MAG: nucleotidyltransferase family protein [Lacibacter sp.]|jgi:predicted nucleotidyltransferase